MDINNKFKELSKSLTLLTVSTQIATQSTKELAEEMKKFQSRYHPVIWFFMKWLIK